jgi:hypothetical protein
VQTNFEELRTSKKQQIDYEALGERTAEIDSFLSTAAYAAVGAGRKTISAGTSSSPGNINLKK